MYKKEEVISFQLKWDLNYLTMSKEQLNKLEATQGDFTLEMNQYFTREDDKVVSVFTCPMITWKKNPSKYSSELGNPDKIDL